MNAFLQRYALGVALILLFLVGISGYFMIVFREQAQAQAEEKELLAAQLREINEEQKTAIITRRVSSQLEEIAYQQKEISDQQRQEAIHQTQIAEQMRDHAELEREKAIVAQQAALEAYEEMDAQKRIAEQRRAEAVMAQMRTSHQTIRSRQRAFSSPAQLCGLEIHCRESGRSLFAGHL